MIIYIYNKLPRKTVPQRLQRHIVVHDDNECVCVCIYILHYNCIQIDPGSNGSKSSSLSSSWTNHPLRNVYQGGGPKCIKYIFCILSMNISIIAIVRLWSMRFFGLPYFYASMSCLYISLAYLTSMCLWSPKVCFNTIQVLSLNHGKWTINGQFPRGWVENTCWEDTFFFTESTRNHSLHPALCLADQASAEWTGHARPLAKWIGKPGPQGTDGKMPDSDYKISTGYYRYYVLNYFTSSFPHHDIYMFCCWQIFWHSMLSGIFSGIPSGISPGISSGTFSRFLWHTFWHSIWHST